MKIEASAEEIRAAKEWSLRHWPQEDPTDREAVEAYREALAEAAAQNPLPTDR